MMTVSRSAALRSLAAATALGLPFAARPAAAQTATPLRIVLFPGETAATAYYAQELGYFAKANIDAQLTSVQNGSAAAAAVAGGTMDIGFSNPLSVAQGFERGLPFTILSPAAVSQIGKPPSNGLVIAAKNGVIHGPKDLNGKTFSVDVLGGLPHISVRAWIDKNGGDSSTVRFIELPFSQMMSALNSGRIDASEINSAFDPLLGKPDDPVRLIGNSYDAVGSRFCSSCWFSRTDWVASNADLAKRFIGVMKQAAAWANAHPHESAVILAPHTKQLLADIEGSPRVLNGVDMTPDLIQPVIDVAAKYGSLKARFPATDMISRVALAR
jgi:ABC-type nitrate/sulfonate/bicarbonate transport system substrate-binding protein